MAFGVTSARGRILRVFAAQGSAGLALMIAVTLLRPSEPAQVLAALGPGGVLLAAVFFATSAALQSLRFELTRDVSVALEVAAYIAMVPLLGMVLSAWIAVLAAILARLLSMKQIGPEKVSMEDPALQYVRTFGLFGTFGIPVVAAAALYQQLGGHTPMLTVDSGDIVRMIGAGALMTIVNNIVFIWPERAYGYTTPQIARIFATDVSFALMTIPFDVVLCLAYGRLGVIAVIMLAGEMILVYAAARSMAQARAASKQMLQRVASVLTIGRSISLTTTDDLLMTIYHECSLVVDTSVFTIALLGEDEHQLTLALMISDGKQLPPQQFSADEGLNGWVIRNSRPLLLTKAGEEQAYGVVSVDDGLATESWLGIPMVARDRTIGSISVQSYRQNAFTQDDVLLLTTIANQAAVAIDNSRLYEDLENMTYQLEDRVQKRTSQLRETNEMLISADRAKNEFLAKMSHELRTPLNSIIGFSSVLLDGTKDVLSSQMYRFVQNIQTAGHHLLDLINDILDLSKIEAGKVELRIDRFDVRETVASVERVMRGFASEAKVNIVSSVDPAVPMVYLDQGRLKQILFNLLSNAVKFSPVGGDVRMSVAALASEQSPLGEDSIRIEVRDDGMGIAATDVDKIFNEFYQGEQQKKNVKGTGLGLSLTREFVELHHGIIDVESHPGTGATFKLYLPVDVSESQL